MRDETDTQPALTPREEDALADLFETHPEVQAAYVFGSAAGGRRTTRSDLDVAVWLRDTADASTVKLDLLADLVVQYEAIRPNRLVYAAPDYEHGRVFSTILRKYWDFLPYLEVQRAAYKKRLERG